MVADPLIVVNRSAPPQSRLIERRSRMIKADPSVAMTRAPSHPDAGPG